MCASDAPTLPAHSITSAALNLSEEDWALGCLLVFSWGLSRALIGSEAI